MLDGRAWAVVVGAYVAWYDSEANDSDGDWNYTARGLYAAAGASGAAVIVERTEWRDAEGNEFCSTKVSITSTPVEEDAGCAPGELPPQPYAPWGNITPTVDRDPMCDEQISICFSEGTDGDFRCDSNTRETGWTTLGVDAGGASGNIDGARSCTRYTQTRDFDAAVRGPATRVEVGWHEDAWKFKPDSKRDLHLRVETPVAVVGVDWGLDSFDGTRCEMAVKFSSVLSVAEDLECPVGGPPSPPDIPWGGYVKRITG